MTFRASLPAGELAAAAHRAAGVARSSTIPILAHTLLRFERGGLLVAGTNTEQSSGTHLQAEGDGMATVDAAALAAFVKRLKPKDEVDLGVTERGMMAITQGSTRAELPYLPAADLPLDLAISEGVEWEAPGDALADAIACVEPSAAVSDTRYYLNGAFLDLSGAQPILVASDGGTLAAEPIDGAGRVAFKPRNTNGTIIPREALPIIAGMAKGRESVTLTVSDLALGVRAGGVVFKTKLIDGAFPDWNLLVPKGAKIHATVSKAALADTLASVFAFDQGCAKLTFDGERLEVEGYAYDAFHKRSAATAACAGCDLEELTGGPITAKFSSARLADILASLPGAESVTFAMSSAGDGVLVRDPARASGSVRVLMPLRG